MKRSLTLLVLGLVVGTAAHLGYYRLQAPEGGTLDGRLAWMKTELQLSDAQYARIKALHEASGPQLLALSAQVSQLRTEFLAFESARRDRGQVDFIEFARYVDTRRQVNRACLDSTRQLVLAAAEVMTPAQRTRYLDLVGHASPAARDLLN
ncbi:MAG: hypothetical protein HYV95_13315 [Opitutae bacterium]|nr:hypothetical protein [Opitutae bacterium]